MLGCDVVKNCLTCKNRRKVDPDIWDSKADPANWRPIDGDFWECTAEVVFPEFVRKSAVHQYEKCLGIFNLRIFDEGTTYYDGLQRDCPLWTMIDEELPVVHHKQYHLPLEGGKRGKTFFKT